MQTLEGFRVDMGMVLGMTIDKLDGIDGCWTGPPVLIDLCWKATRPMFQQLGTESTWGQSKHGSEFLWLGKTTCFACKCRRVYS